jgi:ribosomal 50S subunit-associated protein YjgA (DUF615 family)
VGRKRKTTFEWTADGSDEHAPERGEREDRKALKAKLAETERVVKDMAALQPAKRARLPLEPEVLEALEVYVGLRRGPAVERQLAYVRGLLRDTDLDALRAAIDALRA